MSKSFNVKNKFQRLECDVKGCTDKNTVYEKTAGMHLCKKHLIKFAKWAASLTVAHLLLVNFFHINILNLIF